mmetsp:Transcript_13399/g.44136  ORF Transcript_13399/g.44136 Transcript_13399/m.44136 type:complete len:308 (-) Transcript_13399:79-1002(-)
MRAFAANRAAVRAASAHRLAAPPAPARGARQGSARPRAYASAAADGEAAPTQRPFLVGVAGGTASGKTLLTEKIVAELRDQTHSRGRWEPGAVVQITQDQFYRSLSTKERADISAFNFDHPAAFDWELMLEVVTSLRTGQAVKVPLYDYVTSSRSAEMMDVQGAELVIFEGILAFHDPQLRELFDLKLFVDTDADTRLGRRIRRDTQERGRDVDRVLEQYERHVKPGYDTFVAPTKAFADIIVPRGAENRVALELVVNHMERVLESRHEPSDGELHRPPWMGPATGHPDIDIPPKPATAGAGAAADA